MHFNVYNEAPKRIIETKSNNSIINQQLIEKEKEKTLMNLNSNNSKSSSSNSSYNSEYSTNSTGGGNYIKLKTPSAKNPRKKAPKGKTSYAYQ
jgi:hypothetical protein